MRPFQDKSSNSLEKKAIVNILRRRDMSFKDFGDKLNSVFEDDTPCNTIRSRVERAVNMSRLADLFSLVGHSIMVVPVGVTMTVCTGNGKSVCEAATDKQALLFAADRDGLDIEAHSLGISPHWGKRI